MKIIHDKTLDTTINEALTKLSKRKCVEVSLFVIEEIIFLRAEGVEYAELIKKWLKNYRSVTMNEFENLQSKNVSSPTLFSVFNNAIHTFAYKKEYCHSPTANAIYYANKITGNESLYFSYAKSLNSKLDQIPNFQPCFNTLTDILIFFDYLNEFHPDHNIFSNNSLNIPKPYEIKGDSLHHLASKIYNSKFAKLYLERLFVNVNSSSINC